VRPDPKRPPLACRRFRVSLPDLLCAVVGIAGIIAVSMLVHQLPEPMGRKFSAASFTFTSVVWSLVGYLAGRLASGRVTGGLLVAMMFAGIAGYCMAPPKSHHHLTLAALGMVVSGALSVGFGWLDRHAAPVLGRLARPPDARDQPADDAH
jgi:hypothetical protein